MKRLLPILFALLLQTVVFAQTQILAPMPAQTSTFTGNVRGYYFVAPTCFTITGVEVPTTASSGAQSIAIVRFYSTPPTFSVTTNAFTTLFLTQNNSASGIIPVNIQVEQGDIIGVLGQRATVNSYSSAGNTTIIEGNTVTLNRLGMQFPLTTTAPQQLWTEASSNISRVNLYYDSLITYNATATQLTPNSFQFANGADTSFSAVWDFGDGSPLDNTDNPTHAYAISGTYNVCCAITNSCGTVTVCTTVTACAQTTAAYSSSANGATVAFTDGSTNLPTSWNWDFGDAGTSTQQNPTHTYAASGTYNVCLIAANACTADTICTTVTVCVPVAASFSSAVNGTSAQFTDASSGGATSWFWDFGDAGTSTQQNPSHTYAADGTYNVCLITSSGCDADTLCTTVTVCAPVVATYSTVTNGGTVAFTDGSSSNATSWTWDFGDSSPLDNTQNPSHTYTADGNYSVCLIASSGCDADTNCAIVTICLPVTAAYTASNAGYTVNFTDGSTNGTSWAWDFGDGSPVDSTQNPAHTYAANGVYTVCLIVASGCDADTICTTVTVCVSAVANFNSSATGGTVLFTDESSDATSWIWTFGDGSPADSSQNPTHTYTVNGTYQVCQIAINSCSSDTVCFDVTVCPEALAPSFTASGTNLNYNFTNGSTGASGYLWDFDDNNATSSVASPAYTFTNSGLHIVCLTAWNDCGDTTITCDSVLVQVVGISETGNGTSVNLYPNPMSESTNLLVQSSELSGVFTLEIFDMAGQLVRSQNGTIGNNMQISNAGLASGAYFYRVSQNGMNIGNGKLIVQ